MTTRFLLSVNTFTFRLGLRPSRTWCLMRHTVPFSVHSSAAARENVGGSMFWLNININRILTLSSQVFAVCLQILCNHLKVYITTKLMLLNSKATASIHVSYGILPCLSCCYEAEIAHSDRDGFLKSYTNQFSEISPGFIKNQNETHCSYHS